MKVELLSETINKPSERISSRQRHCFSLVYARTLSSIRGVRPRDCSTIAFATAMSMPDTPEVDFMAATERERPHAADGLEAEKGSEIGAKKELPNKN